MTPKNFLTISTEECQVQFRYILANSDRKFRSAETLAKDEDYGSAIALLIISNEELIKALILFLDGQGFEFRGVKGMRSLFQNHRLRYLLAMIFSIIISFAEDLRDLALNLEKNKKTIQDILNNQEQAGRSLQAYFLKKAIRVQREIEFFSKVDNTRQIGLYSDRPEGLQLSKSDYLQFHLKVNGLRTGILGLMESYADDSNESIVLIKEMFKKNGWYKNIAELIGEINSPKINSYQNLSHRIELFRQELLPSPENNPFLMDFTNQNLEP